MVHLDAGQARPGQVGDHRKLHEPGPPAPRQRVREHAHPAGRSDHLDGRVDRGVRPGQVVYRLELFSRLWNASLTLPTTPSSTSCPGQVRASGRQVRGKRSREGRRVHRVAVLGHRVTILTSPHPPLRPQPGLLGDHRGVLRVRTGRPAGCTDTRPPRPSGLTQDKLRAADQPQPVGLGLRRLGPGRRWWSWSVSASTSMPASAAIRTRSAGVVRAVGSAGMGVQVYPQAAGLPPPGLGQQMGPGLLLVTEDQLG